MIHFLASDIFEWKLEHRENNTKNVVDWKWYRVDSLDWVEWVAPNIVAVTGEMIKKRDL